MSKQRFNAGFIAEMGLLIAIELVMKLTGLGSVPVGPLYMSFLTVPIAIAAMLLGPTAGSITGAVFGIVSFYDAVTGVSVMTGTFFQIDPVRTFVLCIGTRILMGFLVGVLFRLFRLIDRKRIACYLLGSISAPLLNTLLFMGYIVLVFYRTDYIQGLVEKLGAANPVAFVAMLVGAQGMIEAVVCGIAGTVIAKTLVSVLPNHKERKNSPREEARTAGQ